ncbi:hypothetical protein [Robiginitalea biformata]|uniref:Uncharacterized protein n=1 Tax=Robiginitalea biformata (strain ATCC BAA-864 / DSM 15991 / KCTC 12146 / HTCC2501) TaxID=313596 RepID=A4CKQ5_ROBBH|nr:hypothetical protein [Robiginitalea biformata]EAR15454.1 hypothetical protein RB2501_14039 [Robiginitalea biformata HTCC2501]
MSTKKVQDINVKVVAINAAVSAIATAITLAVVGKFFSNKPAGLSIPAKLLANLPLERQSALADMHTIMNVNNAKFLAENLPDPGSLPPEFYQRLTPPQVGNLAFVAQHSRMDYARDHAREILINFKKYA